MRIQNNVTAQNSHRQYGLNITAQGKNMEKLSSGYRVNRAADDAAGLAISEKMRTQIRGLSMAARNVQDGVSLLQVADGAMQECANIIQRMREIAVQSANGTNDQLDREALDLEYQQLLAELDQIAETTNFNGVYPLKGDGIDIPYNVNITGTPAITSSQPSFSHTAYAGPNPTVPPATTPTTTGVNNTSVVNTMTIPEVADVRTTEIASIPSTGIDITAAGNYYVSASAIASGATINITNSGATLVVVGDLTNSNISFTGAGGVRIEGNAAGSNISNSANMTVTGALVNVNNTGSMRVTGDNATVIGNSGNMIVAGNDVTVSNNAAGANLRIEGTGCTVAINSGNLRSAQTMTVGLNTSTGQMWLGASGVQTGQIGTNEGDAYILGSNTADTVTCATNKGNLQIIAGGGRVTRNEGQLSVTTSAKIGTNTGTLSSQTGDGTTVTDNYGSITFGYAGNAENIRITTNHAGATLLISGGGPLAWLGTNNGIARLIHNGTSATMSVGTNTGQLFINNPNAVVGTNSGANAQVRLAGAGQTLTNNYAYVYMANTNQTITTNYNSGRVYSDSTNARIVTNNSGGRVEILGNNGIVETNNGRVKVSGGTGTTIWTNGTSGDVRFDPTTDGRVVLNNGRIEVGSGSTMTRLDLNKGLIFVESGGTLSDDGSATYATPSPNPADPNRGANAGNIHTAPSSILVISENQAAGSILTRGTATVTTNAGFMEVGVWPAPIGGSAGSANVGSNTGTIRNFSSNLTVGGSSGPVENYGITNASGPQVRHHVRAADVSGVGIDGAQSITVTANGTAVSLTASWVTVGGVQMLSFGPATHPSGGAIIFDAMDVYNSVPDTKYSIGDILDDVYGSTGTSGRRLIFNIAMGFYIQSGANEGDKTELTFQPMNPRFLGRQIDAKDLGSSHIRDMANASRALTITKDAINDVSIYRAALGAQYNRLEYKYDNLNVSTENLQAAESRIRDTDMAKEMTVFTKNNILTQASTAMLAQANALPQGVLQLLG